MIRIVAVPLVRSALALAVLALGLCGACTRPAPVSDRQAELAALDPEARRLFNLVEQEHLLHRSEQVLDLGEQLLADYPDHPLGDVVVGRMISAALRLEDLDRAQGLALALAERYPASRHRDEAMLAAAAGLQSGGRTPAALRVLAALADAQQDPSRRRATLDRARPLVAELDADTLRGLALELGATPLAPMLLAHLETGAIGTDRPGLAAAPQPGRIGVLVPVTGRYARFGNAFHAAVRLAAAASPQRAGQPWEIVLEDTEGDVVGAALAARRLITEHQCQVLVGALLSATTATAALVADQHRVPLISPTATHEQLGRLSPQVLQTNLTGRLEAEILARLASEVLLKERFAIIRPDTPEAAGLAEAFTASVELHQGQVVLETLFDPAATDFRTQIQALRAVRPEVVFAPASVDQMILLGPQLDFYHVGALVLGPSDWNSARLLQRAGSVMEQAICAGSEVVYPASWSRDFQAAWPAGQHDEESTRIARGAYLAVRMALQTMVSPMVADVTGIEELPSLTAPPRLADVLRAGFSGRSVELSGAGSFSNAVRMISGGEITAFPGHLYDEALRRQAAARADSLAAALTDSLAAARPDSLLEAAAERAGGGSLPHDSPGD